ncbi:MAG: type I-E CRISPR-associated protein Cse2/CasB [Chloroflexi bacterium]|nr:type I-E CRISPR-associated protein Cse2/CasB [Chloroflexota bacterium]
MSPPTDREQRFVAHLAELVAAEDRAALAALRRGLGKEPGEAAEVFPYVVPWLSSDAGRRDREDEEQAYFLVASLFAWHQGAWPAEGDRRRATNLGASFRLAARSRDEGGEPGVERRFVALLNCHRADLPVHLRHAVGLLKAKEIPVDWAELLHDIRRWDSASRSVQRAWARAYWDYAGQPDDAAHATDDQAATAAER